MAEAGVLMRIAPGKEMEVLEAVRKLEHVKRAYLVTGRFDAIAMIVAPDMDTIVKTVLGEIRKIDGVLYTETLLATGP